MSADIEVIEAGLGDLDRAAPLFDAYRQFYKFPSDVAAARQFLHDRLAAGESRVYLATRADEAVGFMQLYPSFSSLSMRRSFILYDLFVAASARRRGVAARLLDRARELGQATSASELTLATAITNRGAQRLYERLGWRRDEEFYYYALAL